MALSDVLLPAYHYGYWPWVPKPETRITVRMVIIVFIVGIVITLIIAIKRIVRIVVLAITVRIVAMISNRGKNRLYKP